MQMSGGGEAVACVVAHTANDRRALTDEPGDLPSRRLHEPLDGNPEALRGQRVGLSDLPAAKSR